MNEQAGSRPQASDSVRYLHGSMPEDGISHVNSQSFLPAGVFDRRVPSADMPLFDLRGYLSAAHAALPKDGIDRNNTIAIFLMSALPAVAGTTISVILYASFIWAILSLAFGRFEYRLTRSDRMLAWSFTIFAIAIIATALAGKHIEEAPRKLVWLLGFLSPWAIIPRLRAGASDNYLTPYIAGAAVGAVGACVMAIIQLKILEMRPEGGAGNANVFAVMSLCLMGLGTLIAGEHTKHRIALGLCAMLGGAFAVLLSLTRGAVIVMPAIALLAAAYSPFSWRPTFKPRTLLAILAIISVAIFGTLQTFEMRANETAWELAKIDDGVHTTSIGKRLLLWHAAADSIARSPIWGFGIQNRMDVLHSFLGQGNDPVVLGFSHAHNGFLTSALDGGILGLAALIAMMSAPIVISLRAPLDVNYRLRLFMALIVTGAYASCGMTQIMFNHDIMDSFFIFFAIIIAASIPDEAAARI